MITLHCLLINKHLRATKTNIRQSRRQQHLSPEQSERDDIHQRGFRRRTQDRTGTSGVISDDLETEYRTNQAILQRTLIGQQQRNGRITTPSDVEFRQVGAAPREGLRTAGGKHPRHRRQGERYSRGRDSDVPKQLTNLLRQQQSLLEKYDRRLQRLQRTNSPLPDNLEFRIRGADQTRHGVGYTSSDQEDEDTRQDPIQEPLSIQSFAQEQQRATQNPHGREALDIRRDNMETSLRTQRQGQQFVQEAMSDSMIARRVLERTPSSQVASADKRRRLTQQITSPTPDNIAIDRQALHALMLKLSEELCSAVEKNDLPRAEALRGVLETLRATHDSRPANKSEPREPRNWP